MTILKLSAEAPHLVCVPCISIEPAPSQITLLAYRIEIGVNPIEPRSATSDFNKDDNHFTVYVESQGPHAMRERLAASLGVEEKQIQV